MVGNEKVISRRKTTPMDNTSYRSNRHATQAQPATASEAPEQSEAPRPASRSTKQSKKSDKGGLPLKWILVAVAAVVVIAGGWYLMRAGSVAGTIDNSKLQAVFFTNGQVYFGNLKVVNNEYMKLTDIYYLQAKTASEKDNPQQTSAGSDVQLIKLGDEIHGPEDQMVFNKSQVLFFENLKKDGNVSKTIENYQKN